MENNKNTSTNSIALALVMALIVGGFAFIGLSGDNGVTDAAHNVSTAGLVSSVSGVSPVVSSGGTTPAISMAQSNSTTNGYLAKTDWSLFNGKLDASAFIWSGLGSKPTTLSGFGITDPIVLTSGSYSNPSWLTSLDGGKLIGTVVATNGVVTIGSYSNPSWLTSLAWSKLTSVPTTVSGFGITDGVSTGGSYSNPSWITGLAWSKITSAPSIPTYWYNGTAQTAIQHQMFTGTTTSGSVTFYMTNGGTSGGTALCTTSPYNITPFVDDPSNIFGASTSVNMGAKSITVTVNQRNFAGITVVGIPVLGSTSLASAPNGTMVRLSLDCN